MNGQNELQTRLLAEVIFSLIRDEECCLDGQNIIVKKKVSG